MGEEDKFKDGARDLRSERKVGGASASYRVLCNLLRFVSSARKHDNIDILCCYKTLEPVRQHRRIIFNVAMARERCHIMFRYCYGACQ